MLTESVFNGNTFLQEYDVRQFHYLQYFACLLNLIKNFRTMSS